MSRSRSTVITRSFGYRDRQVGGVDDGQLRLDASVAVDVEEELLLHCGDVGVRLLDVEARRDAEVGCVADVPVDHEDVPTRDEVVLDLRDAVALLSCDRLMGAGLGVVAENEGRCLRAGDDAVWTLRLPWRVRRAFGIDPTISLSSAAEGLARTAFAPGSVEIGLAMGSKTS